MLAAFAQAPLATSGARASPWPAAAAALLAALLAAAASVTVQRRASNAAAEAAAQERSFREEEAEAERGAKIRDREIDDSARREAALIAHRLETELARLEGTSAAYRTQMQGDEIADLSATAVELVAVSASLIRARNDESWSRLMALGETLTARIRLQRHRLMLLSGDLEEPLLRIGDLPKRAAAYVHRKAGYKAHDPEAADKFLALANELKDALFRAVRTILMEGRQLTDDEAADLHDAARRLDSHWEATHKSPEGWSGREAAGAG